MSDTNYLPQHDDRDTTPLPSDKRFREAPFRRPHVLDTRLPRAIRFITSDLEKVSTVKISPMMVVGCRNSMKDMDVVFDLSSYNAHKMGVSRYHSMIITLENRVTIKDLNSLNGTRLNNLDLEPSQEYLLEHGDTVRFGKLSFLVAFVY
jgi:hypothetical protein